MRPLRYEGTIVLAWRTQMLEVVWEEANRDLEGAKDMLHRENLIRKIMTMIAYFIKFLRMPMRPLRHFSNVALTWRAQTHMGHQSVSLRPVQDGESVQCQMRDASSCLVDGGHGPLTIQRLRMTRDRC